MYFRARAIARFWKYAVWSIEINIPKITSDSLVDTACCPFFPLIDSLPAFSRERQRGLERKLAEFTYLQYTTHLSSILDALRMLINE